MDFAKIAPNGKIRPFANFEVGEFFAATAIFG